jgi:hypothetical protein
MTTSKQPQTTVQPTHLIVDGRLISRADLDKLMSIKPRKTTVRGDIQPKAFSLLR